VTIRPNPVALSFK